MISLIHLDRWTLRLGKLRQSITGESTSINFDCAAEGATAPETLRQKDRKMTGALESRPAGLTDGVIPFQ